MALTSLGQLCELPDLLQGHLSDRCFENKRRQIFPPILGGLKRRLTEAWSSKYVKAERNLLLELLPETYSGDFPGASPGERNAEENAGILLFYGVLDNMAFVEMGVVVTLRRFSPYAHLRYNPASFFPHRD